MAAVPRRSPGGPVTYHGRQIKAAHHHVGGASKISASSFHCSSDALREGGVEQADIATIIAVVGSVRGDIVSA
jgi:hypothetical protein